MACWTYWPNNGAVLILSHRVEFLLACMSITYLQLREAFGWQHCSTLWAHIGLWFFHEPSHLPYNSQSSSGDVKIHIGEGQGGRMERQNSVLEIHLVTPYKMHFNEECVCPSKHNKNGSRKPSLHFLLLILQCMLFSRSLSLFFFFLSSQGATCFQKYWPVN